MVTKSNPCARCDKEMTDGKGKSLQGISINVHSSIDGFDAEFMKKQMGKYDLDTEYTICFECLIDRVLGG